MTFPLTLSFSLIHILPTQEQDSSFYYIKMAFGPRYAAADIPYLSEYDPTLNAAGRTPMKQRCLPIDHDRLEANREQKIPHCSRTHSMEDLRRADDEVAARYRALYARSQQQYDSQDHQDHGRRERLYHNPPPYDPADEWYSGQRARRWSRDPPKYDATDADLGFHRRGHHANHTPPLHHVFDDDPFDSERRHRFDTDPRPFHPRDLASSDFDEGSRHDMNLRSRTPLIRREPGRSHGICPDYYDNLHQGVMMGTEPCLDNYDEGLNMALSSCRCDIGRAGVLDHIDPRFRKDFEDHVYEAIPSREVHARWPAGFYWTGYRSNLPSFNHEIDPGTAAAADFKYGHTPAEWRSEIDTKDQQDAQLERQFSETDPRITYLGHSPRDSRLHRRHDPHKVANPRGRHHYPDPLFPSSEDNAARFRQPRSPPVPHPTNNIRTNTSYNAPKPFSYCDFLRPPAAQVTAPTRTARAENPYWLPPPPASAAAINVIADTAPDAALGIKPQPRPGNKTSAPDSTGGEKKKSNNLNAVSREDIPAPTARATSVGDRNEGSSSDGGGCDTPEEEEDEDDSERCCGVADDEEGGGGKEVRRTMVCIEL